MFFEIWVEFDLPLKILPGDVTFWELIHPLSSGCWTLYVVYAQHMWLHPLSGIWDILKFSRLALYFKWRQKTSLFTFPTVMLFLHIKLLQGSLRYQKDEEMVSVIKYNQDLSGWNSYYVSQASFIEWNTTNYFRSRRAISWPTCTSCGEDKSYRWLQPGTLIPLEGSPFLFSQL